MDNLTHTLFGFTLSRTSLERAGRGTTAALLLASNAPDLDIVEVLHGGRLAYLAGHRDITHGLAAVVPLAAITATAVWGWQRWQQRRRRGSPAQAPRPGARPDASFLALLGVSVIGVLGHVLMDLCTSYGTRLLSPFHQTWYAFDFLPIIDIYLWAILLAATLACALRPAQRRRIATTALALTAGWYGLRATAHQAARNEAIAQETAQGLVACTPAARGPAPWLDLVSWPGRAAPKLDAPATSGAAPSSCVVQTAALPTFLSPFEWRIVQRFPDAYALTDINVLDDWLPAAADGGIRQSLRYPDSHAPAVREAAAAPPARILLDFARFPAARVFTTGGRTEVSWIDVRFAGGITSLTARRPADDTFRATVVVDPAGRVLNSRLGGD
ncbi:MAG: metal-dependent hydrolase [Acidobacteriota bacterium]|nr:metal-dependent hydrolase [Acidobacteriota bacterium]